jgi:hypothetical protein
MGVEPTMASSSLPINGFEDRGGHRVSTTPTYLYHTSFLLWGQESCRKVQGKLTVCPTGREKCFPSGCGFLCYP